MIAPGLAGVETQLWIWMVAMIRPGAAFLAAPVFGTAAVPVQLRLVIALAVGIPAAAATDLALPPQGMASLAGALLVAAEVVTGLAMGFALQIGFAAALLAGETISNTMGLGFASMADPVGGQSSAALGQFLSMLATFLFLGMGGHLALAAIVVESYRALPPGAWLSAGVFAGMVKFGGLIFALGLAIALPVGFALVLVQIVMGVIARAAPSLNLFAVGLPATVLAGIVLLVMAAPVMADGIAGALETGIAEARRVAAN